MYTNPSLPTLLSTVIRKPYELIGKPYELTGPESLTYIEAAEILSTEAGKKIRYINISEDQVRQGIKEMGMNDWHANVIVELLRITRDGYVSQISSAVENVTAKEPISFSTFAKEYGSVLK